MKVARKLVFFLAVLPVWASQAQDLRVRLYTLHPPTELTVKAAPDSMQWRTCPGCPKNSATSAFYHQNCGGTTAASREVWPSVSEPYLRTHSDPYCVAASPLKWESGISVADLDAALRAAGLSAPAGWTAIEIVSRSESGRAQRLCLKGRAAPDNLISASSFRYAVNRALGWNKIRGDLYNLRNDGDHILFSGRGSGHGVGLCQAGAEEMARQGKDYREILDFYFPGTHLSKTSSNDWQKRSSERFELVSTAPDEDSALLPVAEKILWENENAIGWRLSFRARLQVFPTLDRYRDTTGQPGWVAATTRGQTVRLQPLAQLRKRSVLESTLRHEFFHLLIEPRARPGTPLWFREGLVLYLSEPNNRNSPSAALSNNQTEEILLNPGTREKQQKAYTAARARVAQLIQQNGKTAVLDWLSSGIPSDALGRTGAPSDQGTSHHP